MILHLPEQGNAGLVKFKKKQERILTKDVNLEVIHHYVSILALSLNSWVTLGKLCHFLEPQFLICEMRQLYYLTALGQ